MKVRAWLLCAFLFSTTALAETASTTPHLTSATESTKLEDLGERSARAGLFLLAALVVGVGLVKRYGKTSTKNDRGIEVEARRQINNRMALMVINYSGRTLLIGQGADSFTMLADLTDPNDKTFAQILSDVTDEEELRAAHG